jgi:hypothetical protein
MFFQGSDPVHQTLWRVVRRLTRANIPYAVAGGLAVHAHGCRGTTDNVDLLLMTEGLAEFYRRFVPKKYAGVPGHKRRFVDKYSRVQLKILVTGHHPGYVSPGPITFPDPADVGVPMDGVRVIDLVTLVELKLAARRSRDLADAVALIRTHHLDETFATKLVPMVRDAFFGCLDEIRRQAQFEALQG